MQASALAGANVGFLLENPLNWHFWPKFAPDVNAFLDHSLDYVNSICRQRQVEKFHDPARAKIRGIYEFVVDGVVDKQSDVGFQHRVDVAVE